MKEKIYKKLERIILADNLATTWKIKCHKFSAEIDSLINQEVEKRIAERMPSEEETEEWMQENRWASARQYIKWLRSRLTCSEKPNNSQKTEGGEG